MVPDFNGIRQQFCDRGAFSTENQADLRCLKSRSGEPSGKPKSFQKFGKKHDGVSVGKAIPSADLIPSTEHRSSDHTYYCCELWFQQASSWGSISFNPGKRPLRAPPKGKSRSP
jgi:hypothetical protein